jgi:hypothetical protein
MSSCPDPDSFYYLLLQRNPDTLNFFHKKNPSNKGKAFFQNEEKVKVFILIIFA